MEIAIPIVGKEYYQDMICECVSVHSKANATRRFTEMMIDLFLSDVIKQEKGQDSYYKMTLKEVIDLLKNDIDKSLLELLLNIKNIGDQGSHYNPKHTLTKENVEKIINNVIEDLFPLILVNHIKKDNTFFMSERCSAKILSTLLPSIREKILYKLITFNSKIDSKNDKIIFHKYVLACHKNNNREKIRRKINQLHNKNIIDSQFFNALNTTIKHFDDNSNILPIPTNMEDSRRNFDNVLKEVVIDNKKDEKLIQIISIFLDSVIPSSLGNLKPNMVFHNEDL